MASTNQLTEFQRFEGLTRRILTTPKSELTKHSSKTKPSKHRAKKRK